MQTERVTFLTSPDHKAALDAFAARSGRSVGHVLREASTRYIAQRESAEEEYRQALDLVVPELEAMLPEWHARFDSMERSIDAARKAIRDSIAAVDAAK